MPKKQSTAVDTPLAALVGKRPVPPRDLLPAAARHWIEICAGLPPDHFSQGDLPLLHAFVTAMAQKSLADEIVKNDGVLLGSKPHPAARLSVQYAAALASLAAKLRICASSRIRADAASLKYALNGAHTWESDPETEEFFQ